MSSTFNNTITQLLTTTPNHADNFNNINSKLLENTKHNKENIDNLTEKVSEIEADTIQINNQIDTLNSKDTELDNKINVLSDDGKISKKGQIYNGYKGRYFSDIFPSGTSLDDVRTNVFCYMQGSDNVPNLPNGLTSANSCLEVQTCYSSDGAPYTTKQTLTRINGSSWVRFYSGADKTWYDWQQIATTNKTEILLLNGWSVYVGKLQAIKIGNLVTVPNVRIKGGVTTKGTVLFNLPNGYRPPTTRHVIVIKSGTTPSLLSVSNNGDVSILYDDFPSQPEGAYNLEFSFCTE